MASREPTPDDFSPECEEFEITAMMPIEPGTHAEIKVVCDRAELMQTRADIKKQGYKIMFMVGRKKK